MTNGNNFQFNKGLSIGHVLTTIGLVIAGFTFIYDLREAIAILQFKGETTEQRLERVIERTDTRFDTILGHLTRLEQKVDDLKFTSNFDD